MGEPKKTCFQLTWRFVQLNAMMPQMIRYDMLGGETRRNGSMIEQLPLPLGHILRILVVLSRAFEHQMSERRSTRLGSTYTC